MAVPKDFSQDGAVGASGLSGNPATSSTDAWAAQQAGAPGSSRLQTSGIPTEGDGRVVGGANTWQVPYSTSANDQFGYASNGRYYRDAGSAQNAAAYGQMFEDGGSVPGGSGLDADGDYDGDMPNDPTGMQARINQALQTVDNALSYGRKLHGLSDKYDQMDNNQMGRWRSPIEGGNRPGSNTPELDNGKNMSSQMAGNIPAQPAPQSESGIPPQRPFPRLDPTANPFGKRGPQKMADAGEDQGQPEDQGIPTDEEEAA